MAKVQHVNKNKNASQEFLDNHQYARKSVQRYERIFGTNFVSTGGATTTSHFCKLIFNGLADKFGGNNEGPYKVLDIGCGIGGSAFYMAQNIDKIESIVGIDLSSNMVQIANEKLEQYKADGNESKTNKDDDKKNNNDWTKKVRFECGDVLKQEFKENTFDVIYSRDTILHIFNKPKLYSLIYKWLKPNGIMFVSDYCCSDPSTHSDKFKEYIAKRGYHLHTPSEYGKIIGNCGFERVITEDRTKQFISILESEKKKFQQIKDVFVKDFSEKDFDLIIQGWDNKVVRCNDGEQRWASFIAYKTVIFEE